MKVPTFVYLLNIVVINIDVTLLYCPGICSSRLMKWNTLQRRRHLENFRIVADFVDKSFRWEKVVKTFYKTRIGTNVAYLYYTAWKHFESPSRGLMQIFFQLGTKQFWLIQCSNTFGIQILLGYVICVCVGGKLVKALLEKHVKVPLLFVYIIGTAQLGSTLRIED